MRTVEPKDGTILADADLTEAWSRNDTAALDGGYGSQRWYPFNNDDYPMHWDDLPSYIRDGVELVRVAEGATDA